MSASFKLSAAIYRRVEYPFTDPDCHFTDSAAVLSHGLARHLSEFAALHGRGTPGLHIICSTILSATVVDHPHVVSMMHEDIRAALPAWPQANIVSAYECASWGYVLRFLADRRYTGSTVVTILDLDAHNFSHWANHSAWGASGFGAMSAWVECVDADQGDILTGASRSANGLMEFGRSIVEFNKRLAPGTVVHAPFFPSATRDLLERVATGVTLAADLHPQYGHCFGSDPWISAIESRHADSGAGRDVVLCSHALNGYFSLLKIHVEPNAPLALARQWPLRTTHSPAERSSHA